ncbi:MAG: ABC transporter permease [Arthrobacter sp.]|nr:ABC transporter permease [Arthrobacter sp.]
MSQAILPPLAGDGAAQNTPGPDGARLATARRRASAPLTVAISALIVLVVIVCAVLHGVINPWAMEQDTQLGSVGIGVWGHALGTDQLGRDVLALLGAGALSAVAGPVVVAAGSLVIGLLLGGVAGYRGGLVDGVVSRYADLVLALPAILLAIVVAGVLGGGYWVTVLVLVVLFSPSDVRLVRGAVMEQMSRPYIESARVLGLSGPRILFRHVVPNVMPVMLANALLNVSFALVAISSLSFLGMGAAVGTADWGLQLADGRALLGSNPLASIAPGVAIVATATSVNLLGHWLADRFEKKAVAR